MKKHYIKYTLMFSILCIGLISFADAVPSSDNFRIDSSSINSGSTNSTSSDFSLFGTIESLAGNLTSSGFILISGFLLTITTAVPSDDFSSGLDKTFNSDGTITITTTSSDSGETVDLSRYRTTDSGTNTATTDRQYTLTGNFDGGTITAILQD